MEVGLENSTDVSSVFKRQQVSGKEKGKLWRTNFLY